jgi:hypothetical protein
MNGWLWNTRHLLLHAPLISKAATNDKAKLSIIRDLYNPLLWSVGLQTNNGFHAISVHHSMNGAAQKIQRIRGNQLMIQSQKYRS